MTKKKTINRKIDNDGFIDYEISFRYILSILLSTKKPTKNGHEKKPPKIIDTVFFRNSELWDLDGDDQCHGHVDSSQYQSQETIPNIHDPNGLIIDWFYTSNQGILCRHKKPSSVSLQQVYERFSTLAKVHNEEQDKAFAIGIEAPPIHCDSSNGSNKSFPVMYHIISQGDFHHRARLSTQDNLSCKLFSDFVAIQPYVKHHDLENKACSYRVSLYSMDETNSEFVDGCETNYSQGKTPYNVEIFILRDHINNSKLLKNCERKNEEVRCVSSLTLERLAVSDSLSETLGALLKDTTMTLVGHIDSATRKRNAKLNRYVPVSPSIDLKIKSIVVDYVLDKNNILWVCNISNTRIGYQNTCDPISSIPATITADDDERRVMEAHAQSLATQSSNESTIGAIKAPDNYEDREKVSHRYVRARRECIQEKKSAKSRQSHIINLEVALAIERRKNHEYETVVSDLRDYRDRINGKLQKLEIALNGLDCSCYKDKLGTLSLEPEGLDMGSFLDRLESIFFQSGKRPTLDPRFQIVPSSSEKKLQTSNRCLAFISTVFWIVHGRYFLWKYIVFKHLQLYTDCGCEESSRECNSECCNENHISILSPTHRVNNFEGEDTLSNQEEDPSEETNIQSKNTEEGIVSCTTNNDITSEEILNRKHRVVINRLLETHHRDINEMESAVENKVKLAVKRAEEVCQRQHSSILNDLESVHRAKEEIITQRLKKVHDQELEALKVQHEQQMLEHCIRFKQRESILRLEFDNDLRMKLNEVQRIDQQEVDRVLCSNLRACDEAWKAKLEAQAEEHEVALRALDERHRSILQEKINLLMEDIKTIYQQREADLQNEFSTSLTNSIDNIRNIHGFEMRSLQEEYELLLQKSELRSKEIGEAQYRRGLSENEALYKSNLDKLQYSANKALEDVKDIAKVQLQEFLRQNANLMQMSVIGYTKPEMDIKLKRSLTVAVAECNRSDNDNTYGIMGTRCFANIKKRQAQRIDLIVEKLDCFKDIVWREMMHTFRNASHIETFTATAPSDALVGTVKNDIEVVKEVIKHVDKKCDEFATLIQKEIQDCAAITSEYEEWIERLEYEALLLKTQKESEERCKVEVEEELRKYQHSHDRDILCWKRIALLSSMDKWTFVSRGLSRIDKMKDDAKISESNHAQSMRNAIDDFNDCKGKMSARIECLEAAVSSFRERIIGIHDSILHHKRDSFLQQKSRSDDLSSQINTIKSEKDSLEVMCSQLNTQLLSLEDNINDVERRIRDHCKISVIQGGTVSEAHTGRKRRLDDEYDALVLTAVRKRNELKVIEDKMIAKTLRKEEIDNEMRQVERELVGILLEQQTIVLSLTS